MDTLSPHHNKAARQITPQDVAEETSIGWRLEDAARLRLLTTFDFYNDQSGETIRDFKYLPHEIKHGKKTFPRLAIWVLSDRMPEHVVQDDVRTLVKELFPLTRIEVVFTHDRNKFNRADEKYYGRARMRGMTVSVPRRPQWS